MPATRFILWCERIYLAEFVSVFVKNYKERVISLVGRILVWFLAVGFDRYFVSFCGGFDN